MPEAGLMGKMEAALIGKMEDFTAKFYNENQCSQIFEAHFSIFSAQAQPGAENRTNCQVL